MARPHIVLVSREVWPFMPGGGIGRGVRDTALALAPECDVTVLTSRRYEPRFAAAAAEPGSWVTAPGITFAWADEPHDDPAPFRSTAHAWSAACRDALAALAAERPIDLVEFGDYGGAAAVTLQARRSADPVLGTVPVVVRLHTTWEMSRALDDQPVEDLAGRVLVALERTSLALADALLAPGPATAAAYRAAYGEDALAPIREVPLAFALPPARTPAPPADGALRVLYVGRLQRLKGADVLVEAVRAIPDAALELTLVGGDTPTGPDGGSMREHVLALAGDDPRVRVAEPVPAEDLPGLVRAHDLIVLPSRFEAFGYVLREANAENRPVLAAPVGGLRDGLVEDRGGWAAGAGREALSAALGGLAADPARVRGLIDAGAPRSVAEEQAARPVGAAYRDLVRRVGGGSPAAAAPERLSVVVTATGRDRDLARTLEALRAFGVPTRVFAAADTADATPTATLDTLTALCHVAAGPTALTAGRRAALALAPDTDAVLLLRAGELPGPDFLERAVQALAADPDAAYATAFTGGVLTGRTPLGNRAGTLVGDGEACATIALFAPGGLGPGDVPDAPAGQEDAVLYARLAAAGRFGAVVPDALVERSHPRPRAGVAPPLPAAPALRCAAADWAAAGD